jgi:cold shock CspA family protein
VSQYATGLATDPGLLRTRNGRVASFDVDAGIGVIETPGGATLSFHCSSVFDGSRWIDPGTEVRFLVIPGQLGQLEARDIVPC